MIGRRKFILIGRRGLLRRYKFLNKKDPHGFEPSQADYFSFDIGD